MVRKNDWHGQVYKKARSMNRRQQEEWRMVKRIVLERDHHRCRRCQKKGASNDRGLSVHHIIPRPTGKDLPENLITLCYKCHDFVELQGYQTWDEITASMEDDVELPPEKPDLHTEESFPRPNWHKWVYGGQRRARG